MRPFLILATWVLVTLVRITPALPCSVFTAHDAQTVLVGANEDYPIMYVDSTIIWFVPATAGKYGYVALGYKFNHAAGAGVNDQGLFFDTLTTPSHPVTAWGTKPFTLTTMEEVMQTSATVDEAIANLKQYTLTTFLEKFQLLFVDKTGSSAIFDGTTVTKPAGNYQICTNFLPADPSLGNYPCWRYTKLEQMMTTGLQLTPSYFASMAKAVKQGTSTLYTTIADLKAGKFYLYYWGNFEKHILFDLKTELSKGAQEYTIADLFKENPDLGVDSGADADLDVTVDVVGITDAGTVVDAPLGGDVTSDAEDTGCSCSAPGNDGKRSSLKILVWLALFCMLVVRLRATGR